MLQCLQNYMDVNHPLSTSKSYDDMVDAGNECSNHKCNYLEHLDCVSILQEYRLELSDLSIKSLNEKSYPSSVNNSFNALINVLEHKRSLKYSDIINHKNKVKIDTISSSSSCIVNYLDANTFLLLPHDINGDVKKDDYIRYIQRSLDVEREYARLLSYSRNKKGYITEDELEKYIFNIIPDIGNSLNLHESFYPFYVVSSCRRFYFFLDCSRSKYISVKTLAHSSIFEDLLIMIRMNQYIQCGADNDSSTMSNNWFSSYKSQKIYSDFMQLDKDRNGMLSQDEFSQYNGAQTSPIQLTMITIARLYEESITYNGVREMDYRTFLDFILAIENKTSVESMRYFWRIIDIEGTGQLTGKVIEYFYNEIYDTLRTNGYDAPPVGHVISEIYDILGCSYNSVPTFNTLVRSKQGFTVLSMLLDVYAFYQYDNRESL